MLLQDESEVKRGIEQKTSRIKDVLRQFSRESGYSINELEERFGQDLLQSFGLSPEEAIKHFSSAGINDFIGESILSADKKRAERKIDQASRLALFWRDLLVNLLHQNEFRKNHFEDLFNVVAGSGLVDVRNSVQDWNQSTIPEVADSMCSNSPIAYELLKRSLITNETVEQRLPNANEGFASVYSIGRKIVSNGLIPLARIMFFETRGKKESAIKKLSQQLNFVSRNQEELSRYRLKDIEHHTQASRENSPLASWTHIPITKEWRYGLNRLGRNHALMLITEINEGEAVWARNLIEGATWVDEEYRWYDKPDLNAPPLNEIQTTEVPLSDYQKKGMSAALMPTEGEVVLWGEHPNKGVIDLGP